MRRGRFPVALGCLLVLAGLVHSLAGSGWTLSLMVSLAGGMLLCFCFYEREPATPQRLVLTSLLSALACTGRILFAGIPSVQPASFVIIVTGMVFGPKMGLYCGMVTAATSNLMLGQGPWTLWQMTLWGGMGLLAGLWRRALSGHRWLCVCYGFVWGFVFGWVMNLWFVSAYSAEVGVYAFLLACAASFPMDLAHAAANAVLLCFGEGFLEKLRRIGVKYGLQSS